jgi:hypothetical protein
MRAPGRIAAERPVGVDRFARFARLFWSSSPMAKPHRKHKKANHGKRPANAKARRAKRWKVKT